MGSRPNITPKEDYHNTTSLQYSKLQSNMTPLVTNMTPLFTTNIHVLYYLAFHDTRSEKIEYIHL